MQNLNFNFNSIIELINTFDTEQKCIDFLELQRWNGNVIRSYDSSSVVWKYKKDNQYKCKNTDKMFNVRTDTLFEKSHISLQKRFLAIWIMTSHKKGISSLQLSKDLKVTQKTAWYMLQRIRKCFNKKTKQLTGEIESDETFIGGRRRHGQGGKGKTIVFGMIERGGELIAKVVPNKRAKTLIPEIEKHVEFGMTDELKSYKALYKYYNH